MALTAGATDTATATSVPFTPTAPGYWCFAGYYSGDSNYLASADTTVDECLQVVLRVTVTTKSLPGATEGVHYKSILHAAGGASPYSWQITAGKLPAGITLNKATGVLSGTPTVSGTFRFTVQVTGTNPVPYNKATKSLTLVIA